MRRTGLRLSAIAALAVLSALTPCSAEERTSFQLLRLEGQRVRWTSAEARDVGQETVVTYGIARAETVSDDAVNCRRVAPLDDLAATSRITPAAFRRELIAAFDLWSSIARIRFVEAAPDVAPDILVGAQAEPVGRAFAQVFFDRTSADGIKPITRSLVCLNPRVPWKIGFDGNLDVYDLRYTLTHEIGHAIGLDHPAARGQIMGHRYDERSRTLGAGDIAGAVTLYGARESRSTARDQATLDARPAAQSVQ